MEMAPGGYVRVEGQAAIAPSAAGTNATIIETDNNNNQDILYISKIIITITTAAEYDTTITCKSDASGGIFIQIPSETLYSKTFDFGVPGYPMGERSTGSTKRALIVGSSGDTSNKHAGFNISAVGYKKKGNV